VTRTPHQATRQLARELVVGHGLHAGHEGRGVATAPLHQAAPAGRQVSITLALYRVVQEGLLNAIRHAQASRVRVSLKSDKEKVVVSISDDGVGLPPDWSRPGHFGLRGLAERVANLGGVFHAGSTDPRGVSLTAEIPLGSNS
jgi:two-component system sensor histidine kinase UhpB